MISKISLVIFDMDGVLVDTEPIYLKVEKDLIGRYGKEIPSDLIERIKGSSLLRSMKIMLSELGIEGDCEELVEEEIRMLRDRFENEEIKPMPCALDTVNWFSSHGFKIALATSTEWENATLILSKLGIEDYFDHITTGDQVEESKPNPEIYLKTAKVMEVNPASCFVVEDSLNGIKSARSAGMNVVAVNVRRDIRDEFLKLTPFVFNSMCELLDGLLKTRGACE